MSKVYRITLTVDYSADEGEDVGAAARALASELNGYDGVEAVGLGEISVAPWQYEEEGKNDE